MSAYRAIWAAAWRNSRADPRAFWVQLGVMAVNDVVWIVFWALFFNRVGTMRGWDVNRIILLQAVLTTGGGIALGLLANARHIGRIIHTGELDATLATPTRPLPQLLLGRIEPIGLGDLVYGIALFAILGDPTPARAAIFVYSVICAAAVMTAFLTFTGASAFFTARSDPTDLGFHAILLFGSYPVDIFRGAASLILHFAIPAAFVAAIPAKLIDDFDVGRAIGLAAAAVITAAAAVALFTTGLRRYTSGATWTQR
jgi:ABC-2 type transport system permease protein